ncbi:MAG: hypothetical protein KDD83_13430 [Caldilineaceae bacterium]|nr:hypothetical protein [Caldilineaceae bacterium]
MQPTIKIVCPKCADQGNKTRIEITMWEGIHTWTGATYCEGCKTRIVAEMEKCRICGKPIDSMEVCDNCAANNLPDVDLEGPGGWMVQDGSGRPY